MKKKEKKKEKKKRNKKAHATADLGLKRLVAVPGGVELLPAVGELGVAKKNGWGLV
jgi:hypothetical protein